MTVDYFGTDKPSVYYLGTEAAEKVDDELVTLDTDSDTLSWTVSHFSDWLVTAAEPEASYTDSTTGKITTGTLETAVANAKDGTTITLLGNVELDATGTSARSGAININKNLTIDGTSEKYTITAKTGFAATGGGSWDEDMGLYHVINITGGNVTIQNLTVDGRLEWY